MQIKNKNLCLKSVKKRYSNVQDNVGVTIFTDFEQVFTAH